MLSYVTGVDEMFEWTIRFGDVLTFLGALFVGAGLLVRWGGGGQKIEDALVQVQRELSGVNTELEKLAQVITLQAVQTVRIDNLSERIRLLQQNVEDLRRGRGFIQDRDAKSVDREY